MENPYSPPRSVVEDVAPLAETKDRPVVGFLLGLLALYVSEGLTMVAQAFTVGIIAFIRGDSLIAKMTEHRLALEAGGGLPFLLVAASVSSCIGGWVCARFARKKTGTALVALLTTTVLLGAIAEQLNWRFLTFIPFWAIGVSLGSRLAGRKSS